MTNYRHALYHIVQDMLNSVSNGVNNYIARQVSLLQNLHLTSDIDRQLITTNNKE
jgi:hypothetical protein